MGNFIKYLLGHSRVNIYLCTLLFLGSVIVVHIIVESDREVQKNQLRGRVLSRASELRAGFEHEINSTLNLSLGSIVYVSSHPNVTQAEFAQFAQYIISRVPYIQNMGLAKDNVITHIYPLKNNKKALGLSYMDNMNQREAVLNAIQSKKTVIAGPVKLVQGGEGFIGRIPIFLNNTSKSYWGIASIVVMIDSFYQKVGLKAAESNLAIALRGKDGKGLAGDVFYGESTLFEEPNILTLHIPLPIGEWVMAVRPIHGWNENHFRTIVIYISGLTISFLLVSLLFILMKNNAQLSIEKAKALDASEHKTRFFTYMAHELRTPLTAIYGSIRILGSGKIANENAKDEILNNAERNCQRLIWLINDILDLRKIETGHMSYNFEQNLIIAIIREAIDETVEYAKQFGISLNFESPSEDYCVNVDEKRIRQVLVNMLSNAIKFSPKTSSVEITASSKDGELQISVSDNGKGIANDKLESIFREFEQDEDQIEKGTQRITASSGLGLTISKKIIEDHNGCMGCYNKDKGGAVFYISLPIIYSTQIQEQEQEDSRLNTPHVQLKSL